MKRPAYAIALGGVLAALAVVLMSLGAMIPLATYCCPLLAMMLSIPVVERCGRRIAWAWYAAVAILSILLCPDPEAAAIYVALGYYPVLRCDLNRINPRALRLAAKLGIFNLATLAMYAVLIWVLQLEAVARDILDEALWLNLLALALGNVTFLLADRALEIYTRAFYRKKKMR